MLAEQGVHVLRVVLLTDTHDGPINRGRLVGPGVAAVNALDPDIVCHTGDIADGSVSRRRAQATPLGDAWARLPPAQAGGRGGRARRRPAAVRAHP